MGCVRLNCELFGGRLYYEGSVSRPCPPHEPPASQGLEARPVLSILSPSPLWTHLRAIDPFVYSLRRHTVESQNTRRHRAESEPYPKLPSASSTVQRHSKVPGESFTVASPLDSQMAGAVFSNSVTRNSDRTKPSKTSRSRPAICPEGCLPFSELPAREAR